MAAQTPPPPQSLKHLQEWFGKHISRPIDANSRMQKKSINGAPLEKEAAKYIVASHSLLPHQRLQIYNQQYWWRLLTIMHEAYPLVTRLFGYSEFNMKLAMPYLHTYPPNHWSLAILGSHLPVWLDQNYHNKNDRQLVIDAACLDNAYNNAFYSAKERPLAADDVINSAEQALDNVFYLQPHVHTFKLAYDLFSWRKEFLTQPPEWWEENDFPKLAKNGPFYFVLGRTADNFISYKSIEPAEYAILSLFKKGSTLDNVCLWLEDQDEAINISAFNNLQRWFQEWTVLQWLTPKKPSSVLEFFSLH